MKSPVVKRSIGIAGHKTSVSLEDAFWKGLKEIAARQGMTLSELVAAIDLQRRHGNLSSAIRLFVLDHFQARTDDDAGNGHAADTGGNSGASAADARETREHRATAQSVVTAGPAAAARSVLLSK
jgi:predicted DNA-binding ribbon-helix-helix protein